MTKGIFLLPILAMAAFIPEIARAGNCDSYRQALADSQKKMHDICSGGAPEACARSKAYVAQLEAAIRDCSAQQSSGGGTSYAPTTGTNVPGNAPAALQAAGVFLNILQNYQQQNAARNAALDQQRAAGEQSEKLEAELKAQREQFQTALDDLKREQVRSTLTRQLEEIFNRTRAFEGEPAKPDCSDEFACFLWPKECPVQYEPDLVQPARLVRGGCGSGYDWVDFSCSVEFPANLDHLGCSVNCRGEYGSKGCCFLPGNGDAFFKSVQSVPVKPLQFETPVRQCKASPRAKRIDTTGEQGGATGAEHVDFGTGH